ncbi:MAG: transketolase, partial [Gemmatimonadota bacterium]|nr:transketolase [Gemmatimonadota bacterium]
MTTGEGRGFARRETPPEGIEQAIATTVRTLALDAVQTANSGHPGMPMGAADLATVLWTRHLRVDPERPDWPGRDRFVLSAGHGSMLLYALLHLSGHDIPLEEIKQFRQWGSRTPGHPERGMTPGVETTTGPLGQGFGNAVGMALAERVLAARFPDNPDGAPGHRTFCIVGDGDLMEGVAMEAAALAGHLGLGRLVTLYDSNDITIDGSTDITWSEDVGGRFEATGWHVAEPVDGHDMDAVDEAIAEALAEEERPSLVICRTTIAKGSARFEGSSKSHGAPLGVDEVRGVKKAFGLDPDVDFFVPEEVTEWFASWREARAGESSAWDARRVAFAEEDPEGALLWEEALSGKTPPDLLAPGPSWDTGEMVPTRKAGQTALQEAAMRIPAITTGSADLAGSNLTWIDGSGAVSRGNYSARNIHYGIREHAMGAIVNGLALHGGVRPVGSTFLVFCDYMRPAIRLAALMELPAIHVFTHDSVHVGEDGPTHQPVEHLDSLRVIPGLHVARPADARETADAWRAALMRTDGPTVIVLTRQGLPVLDRVEAAGVPAAVGGAGIVREPEDGKAAVVLVASGSEVSLCVKAAAALEGCGVKARVVSVPCLETFAAAPATDRAAILPERLPRVVVEAGTGATWQAWVRPQDAYLGIGRFGASAPGAKVAALLG